jgi:hypothetical protein
MSQTNPSVFSGRRSESERTSVESISTYDSDYGPHSPYDTLPLPCEVEKEFLDRAGDDVKEWFTEYGIDAEPIGKIIQYAMVWDTGRYRFVIHGPDHIGEPVLAVPIMEGGKFVDLLLVAGDMSFARATCRAKWLGIITPTTRLHPHPIEWVEAGCTSACHIEPISRAALKELRGAESILCNDIHTALCAWDWGFESDEDELARFTIDDTPGNIRCYFEDEVKWRTAQLAWESVQ